MPTTYKVNMTGGMAYALYIMLASLASETWQSIDTRAKAKQIGFGLQQFSKKKGLMVGADVFTPHFMFDWECKFIKSKIIEPGLMIAPEDPYLLEMQSVFFNPPEQKLLTGGQ